MSHHAISILFIAALLFATTGCTQNPAGNVNDGVNHGVNDGTNQGANHRVDRGVDQGADRGVNDDPAAPPAVDRTTAADPGTTDQDRELDVVVEKEVE